MHYGVQTRGFFFVCNSPKQSLSEFFTYMSTFSLPWRGVQIHFCTKAPDHTYVVRICIFYCCDVIRTHNKQIGSKGGRYKKMESVVATKQIISAVLNPFANTITVILFHWFNVFGLGDRWRFALSLNEQLNFCFVIFYFHIHVSKMNRTHKL